MAGSVVESNEIYLNGVYYPTTKPVRSILASLYPAKVVIGDTTKDSQLRSSIVSCRTGVEGSASTAWRVRGM